MIDEDDNMNFDFEIDDETEDEIISFSVPDTVKDDLRHISSEELRTLGISVVAYVRPAKKNGTKVFEVCAADGTLLSVMQDYNNAMSSIWNNDLHAVRVH